MRFDQQVVIVTGASRGIGKGIAEGFAKEGAKVACLATTDIGAHSTANAIGNGSKGYACNVSDASAVEDVFNRIQEEMGLPAVLVNNAGITRDTLLIRMKDEDWDQVIDVNLKGAFLCIRAVTRPMMKARYGRIVNITSIVGLHGQTGQANYAASKAGIVGLTKSVAKELGSRGITCNAIAPGFIETEMTHSLPEDMRESVLKTAPLGRLGRAQDIAGTVMFLASEDAGYITGQTITVDGGLTL